MIRIWKGFLVIIVICAVLGACMLGAGFVTGGSLETLQTHGDVPAYFETLFSQFEPILFLS